MPNCGDVGGIGYESGKGLAHWRGSRQEGQESKLPSIALANIFSAASIAICCCARFSRSASFIARRTLRGMGERECCPVQSVCGEPFRHGKQPFLKPFMPTALKHPRPPSSPTAIRQTDACQCSHPPAERVPGGTTPCRQRPHHLRKSRR